MSTIDKLLNIFNGSPATTDVDASQLPIGNNTLPTSNVNITSGGIVTITTTNATVPLLGLSIDEKKELDELKAQNEIELKSMKLLVFKKIPAAIRQAVIDGYEWKICYDMMNASVVPKSQRQVDLENKDNAGRIYTLGGVGSSHYTSIYQDNIYFNLTNLPQGVSFEELKKAHMEATLEEEMLDNPK